MRVFVEVFWVKINSSIIPSVRLLHKRHPVFSVQLLQIRIVNNLKIKQFCEMKPAISGQSDVFYENKTLADCNFAHTPNFVWIEIGRSSRSCASGNSII